MQTTYIMGENDLDFTG